MSRVLIAGGLVIDPSQNLEAVRDVLLIDGKVAMVKPGLAKQIRDATVINAKDRWVLPGLVDMHVHLREPGREGDEDIASGTRAAALGGVTTVLAMPNTEPVIDTAALVQFLYSRARTEAVVNVVASGAVTRGQRGEEMAELGKMAEAGAVAVTDDGRPVMNALIMRRALEYSKSIGLPILDHCEDDNLSAGGCMNEGYAATVKGVKGIPAASETVMAMRDIALAELTGGRLHLCHVSAGETVALVRAAKKRGVRVTAETAPHYFTLVDDDVPEYDADFKMNPPLKSKADREAVQEGLSDGTLDAIATDHAPHGPGKKALGLAAAPFGIIGLETVLPLTLALVEKKLLSKKAMVSRLCEAPAAILGLKAKGGLRPGQDGDIAIVDPGKRWTAEAFASKSSNSPFKGRALKGKAEMVLIGGRVVVVDGALAN